MSNTITLRNNFQEFGRRLESAGRQAETNTMFVLNKAAYIGAEAVKTEIRRVFDKPTPWVVGGVRYIKATRSRLVSSIDLDFWGNKAGVAVDQVLKAQIGGGSRRNKRFESALRAIGILPSGMGVVPGSGAELDAYGNIRGGQIVQILSWFQAFGEQGYSANMRDGGRRLGRDNKRSGQRGFAYFALKVRHGKLPPGIYKRYQTGFGSAVKPMMIFVRMPAYKARLDFYGVGLRAATDLIHRELAASAAKAVQSSL